MNAVNDPVDMGEKIRQRIAQVNADVPGSIAQIMQFQLVDFDAGRNYYTMTCETKPWMRNYAGTLYGGLCATILDQAMGFVLLPEERGRCGPYGPSGGGLSSASASRRTGACQGSRCQRYPQPDESEG